MKEIVNFKAPHQPQPLFEIKKSPMENFEMLKERLRNNAVSHACFSNHTNDFLKVGNEKCSGGPVT